MDFEESNHLIVEIERPSQYPNITIVYTSSDGLETEFVQDSTKAFKPYCKKLKDNVQLLWHGSRMTNYAGILSSGLRIAPPEAPVTGYMFGKGIYLADTF